MLRRFIDIPRWLFLGALVFAPWAYGGTPAWVIDLLNGLMATIVLLWLSGCATRRMKPMVSPVMICWVALILLQGWWMALNAHYRHAGGFKLEPVAAWFIKAPGSVDGNISVTTMLRITCLLGIACFAADLSMRREWRMRIWRTIGITGVSLVLFGLFQSASARPAFFWKREDMAAPLFATYYYHGNAGSFINLVLPLVAGLAALTLRKPDAHLARVLWLPGFFICAAGAFVNLSRSAMVITSFLCLILLCWQFMGPSRRELLPPRRLRLAYAALMSVALFFLVAFSGWERPTQKWMMLQSQLNSNNKRLISTRVCMSMLPDAGLFGFGPGTFEFVFPHYTGDLGGDIPGIWKYAHDDYLQTMIEWGWLGVIPWSFLLFGAMRKLYKGWRKNTEIGTSDRVLLFTSGLALVGVALHSLVDFPLQIASLQLYVMTYVGFGWGSGAWLNTKPISTPSPDQSLG